MENLFNKIDAHINRHPDRDFLICVDNEILLDNKTGKAIIVKSSNKHNINQNDKHARLVIGTKVIKRQAIFTENVELKEIVYNKIVLPSMPPLARYYPNDTENIEIYLDLQFSVLFITTLRFTKLLSLVNDLDRINIGIRMNHESIQKLNVKKGDESIVVDITKQDYLTLLDWLTKRMILNYKLSYLTHFHKAIARLESSKYFFYALDNSFVALLFATPNFKNPWEVLPNLKKKLESTVLFSILKDKQLLQPKGFSVHMLTQHELCVALDMERFVPINDEIFLEYLIDFSYPTNNITDVLDVYQTSSKLTPKNPLNYVYRAQIPNGNGVTQGKYSILAEIYFPNEKALATQLLEIGRLER